MRLTIKSIGLFMAKCTVIPSTVLLILAGIKAALPESWRPIISVLQWITILWLVTQIIGATWILILAGMSVRDANQQARSYTKQAQRNATPVKPEHDPGYWLAKFRNSSNPKGLYHELARKYHPDHGGDAEIMKAVTMAYKIFTSASATV